MHKQGRLCVHTNKVSHRKTHERKRAWREANTHSRHANTLKSIPEGSLFYFSQTQALRDAKRDDTSGPSHPPLFLFYLSLSHLVSPRLLPLSLISHIIIIIIILWLAGNQWKVHTARNLFQPHTHTRCQTLIMVFCSPWSIKTVKFHNSLRSFCKKFPRQKLRAE